MDSYEEVLAKVKENGWMLQYLEDVFQDDKDIVMTAVQRNGAIEHTSDRFIDDANITIISICNRYLEQE